MTSSYPGAIDSFTTKVDGVTDIMAAHVNDLQDSLIATQTALSGSPEQNLLYHSLSHDIWLSGVTFSDAADDTYLASLWNLVNNGQTPDASGTAGGSTDPMGRYLTVACDSASSQFGIVQFLEAKDTIPLRGKTVSMSIDAETQGGQIANIRMNPIVWTGTADTLTSDVVGTWGAGNPTLATNWAYIGTPADLAVTNTRAQKKVEGLVIPTNANNIGFFVWTSEIEGAGAILNLSNAQLKLGIKAGDFAPRSFMDELTRVNRFLQLVDASSNTVDSNPGTKVSTTSLIFPVKLDYPMRAAPALVHNITGYTAGAPGTTTVASVNYITNTFFTITGALTVTLSAANKTMWAIRFAAGTSWSGNVGDLATFRVGPDVVALLDARL